MGFEPDPWAWTSWIYPTDAGLFDGRWDDQLGVFRTLYTSASLLGCFLELLAKHRPDTTVEDALAEIDDPGNLVADDIEAPSRLSTRQVCSPRTAYPPTTLTDTALLKNAEDRVLTRSVARWIYDLRDNERNELVDGVEFRSRLADEIHMWAVFERSPDEARPHSNLITPESNAPVAPELVDAFSRLGLHWHEIK